MAQSEYSVITTTLADLNFLSIIVFFTLSVLTLLIRQYISNWFEKRKENERRIIWLKFLRTYSNSIDTCLKEFMTYRSPSFWTGFGGFMLSAFLAVVTLVFLSYVLGDITSALVHSTLISAIPLIASALMGKHISEFKLKTKKMLNDGDENYAEWLRKSKQIVNIIDFVQWFAAGLLWWAIAMALVVYEEKNLQISGNVGSTLILSGYFGFLAFIISISNHRNMREILKSILTAKYSDNYPYVRIKTEFDEMGGFVADIFDEKLIVLREDDKISVAEWNSIANVELMKTINGTTKNLPENK